MAEDPWTDGDGITVTIKYGKGYDDTWAVFRGTAASIKAQMAEFFGGDASAYATPFEMSKACEQMAHGADAIAKVMGGTVVPQEAPTANVHPHAALIEKLGEADSIDALTQLWEKNQQAFKDQDVVAAYKARGRELKEAGS